MPDHPTSRISDWDSLMTTLDVNFVRLAECYVSPGWKLAFPPVELTGLHYNISGYGQMIVGDEPPVALSPDTLIVVPPRKPIRFEVVANLENSLAVRVLHAELPLSTSPAGVDKFIAGGSDLGIAVICGYFRASYAASIDLFSTLLSPIVERFDVVDELGKRLKLVVAELSAQEIGMHAMTAALLKQVLVMLLRRSLNSPNSTLEHFSLLNDPQVTRAFADMAARPGAPHSLSTLTETAGLSRSAFMARFARAFGCSPMAALRQIRMRHAAHLLVGNTLSIEQVARAAGYESRSSFVRAFREAYHTDPSDYRAAASKSVDVQPGDGIGIEPDVECF